MISIWVVGASGIDLFLNWVVEQSMFESSVGVQDFRWLTHAISSGVILLPCLLAVLFVKHPRTRNIFVLWTFAASLAVLAIPLKKIFLTSQNETAIAQIGVMLVVYLSTFFFHRKTSEPAINTEKRRVNLPGAIMFVCAALCIPWILWGALGSVLDTLLELLVGLTFGLLSVRLIFTFYLEKNPVGEREPRIASVLMDGFVIFVYLVLMVMALAQNGSQQILVIIIPVMGWLVAIFYTIWKDRSDRGKLPTALILSLVMALPLVFFDMDEMSSLFAGGQGEILELAVKAAWYTFMGLLSLTLFMLTNVKGFRKVILPKRTNIGLTAIALTGVIAVYVFWGQVGFFGDNSFIILKEQADLSSIQNITDVSARRQAVYEDLVSTAQTSQADLIARMDRMHLDYKPYYLLNAIEVEGGSLVQLILKNNPAVDRILDSPQLRPLPQKIEVGVGETSILPDETLWNLKMIQSDRVNDELGITGEGIVIGQTDSGVDGRHPELAASYRGVDSSDDFNWYDPWNSSPFPTDSGSHGTETLSVILGQNTGVAPGAEWIGCINLARNLGNPARYLECMQFMLAPFPQGGDPFTEGDPSKGAMVVNNSWGCPDIEGCDSQVYSTAVKALKTAGIFMAVSAGNNGYYGCGTITDPLAIYPEVFTVGSVNLLGEISGFSSLGPVLVDGSGRQKPDLVAPGDNVLTAFPGGTYMSVDGTSYSSPHVAGVVALMWSANPALIGNIDATSEILRSTTQAYSGSDPDCGSLTYVSGAGILDAYQAVQEALEYSPVNP